MSDSKSWLAWLVELEGSPPKWLTYRASGYFGFTDVALDALHYVRKSDAELMTLLIEIADEDTRVVEHEFVG